MHKIAALALVATMLGGFAAPSFATENKANLCGPDAPEAYNRPGGFCEQLKDNKSMGTNDQDDTNPWFIIIME